MFGDKSNNILQIGITLNNETSDLESFFQIFGMVGRFFHYFWQFQKNKIVCNQAKYHNIISYYYLVCHF
jgi:hypothetical protein